MSLILKIISFIFNNIEVVMRLALWSRFYAYCFLDVDYQVVTRLVSRPKSSFIRAGQGT